MHYFDNAATTFPKPEGVYKEMDSFYREYGVNVGRGQFKEASIANRMVEETRKMMLDLLHATSEYSCVFTSSATEALNTILKGIAWKKGMSIYLSPFEHNAVLRTVHFLEKEFDLNVVQFQPNDQFEYDFNSIQIQFSKIKPDVVVLTHASNVFGFVNPVSKIFSIAKQYSAITVCDMAQTAGLIDTDVVHGMMDYAVFAGHKTLYAPFGVAGFITNQKCRLQPFLLGGTGLDSKNLDMPEEMPTKYEAGSHNVLSIAGLHAALEWNEEIGISKIFQVEKENTQKLLNILNKHKNIHVIRCANESQNIGVVSCVFEGYSSDSIGQVLSDHDIAVRTGLHCSPKAHEFLHTAPAGTVRFSISYFTTEDDFIALDQALLYIEENS